MHISVLNSHTPPSLECRYCVKWRSDYTVGTILCMSSRLWNVVCQCGSHRSGVTVNRAIMWDVTFLTSGHKGLSAGDASLKENIERSYQSHFTFTSFWAITCEHAKGRNVGKNYDPNLSAELLIRWQLKCEESFFLFFSLSLAAHPTLKSTIASHNKTQNEVQALFPRCCRLLLNCVLRRLSRAPTSLWPLAGWHISKLTALMAWCLENHCISPLPSKHPNRDIFVA